MAIAKVNPTTARERRATAYREAMERTENKVHISNGNSKMGVIPSFSLLPLVTCKNCSECSHYCYACKGCFNFNKNIESLADNTALMVKDIERVETEINKYLNGVTLYRYFRWNVSGDIFDKHYLKMIESVALKNPHTKFLAFTKNYELINERLVYGDLPNNLTIVFSKWDNMEISNPFDLPVAITKVNEETEIPENAFHCNGDCSNCLNCWNATKNSTRYFDLH